VPGGISGCARRNALLWEAMIQSLCDLDQNDQQWKERFYVLIGSHALNLPAFPLGECDVLRGASWHFPARFVH